MGRVAVAIMRHVLRRIAYAVGTSGDSEFAADFSPLSSRYCNSYRRRYNPSMASNSRDKISVGIDVHMAYLSGVREGDMIEAHASEISRTRRKAVYHVDVRRPADDVAIATFTGTVFVTEQDIAEV